MLMNVKHYYKSKKKIWMYIFFLYFVINFVLLDI